MQYRFSVLLNFHRYIDVKHEIETGLWIAGTDDDVEGRWEWKDGYSYRPIHGFTHWYPGEPDSGTIESLKHLSSAFF